MAKTVMTGSAREGFSEVSSETSQQTAPPMPHVVNDTHSLQVLTQTQAAQPSTPAAIPMCTIAQKGNYLSALNAKSAFNGPWVIDSGTSDHMTEFHK